MQLSPATIEILQQFSTINESIKIEPGSTLRTMDKSRAIYASATIAEDFPNTVSIASIREFLALYDLFEEPTLTFTNKSVEFTDGKQHAHYWFADPESFRAMPATIKKSYKTEVSIKKHDLQNLLKAAYTLKVPEIRFFSDVEGIHVRAINTELSTSNYYDILLSEDEERGLDVRLHIDRCKLLARDYTIGVGGSPAIFFMGEGIEYAIAASA